MPTALARPVTRRCTLPHRGRRLVVTLMPGDVLELRPERTRRAEYLPIAAAYDLAVKMRVAAERADRGRRTRSRR
jgi:hypothetical protein